MRNQIGVAPQMGMDGGDVKRTQTLVLEFAMLNYGAVSENQFRHRVGEIGRIDSAGIAFENGRLTARFGDDQIAGVERGAILRRRGDENQMNRSLDLHPGGNPNEAAIPKKGGVQRGEGIFISASVARQTF